MCGRRGEKFGSDFAQGHRVGLDLRGSPPFRRAANVSASKSLPGGLGVAGSRKARGLPQPRLQLDPFRAPTRLPGGWHNAGVEHRD